MMLRSLLFVPGDRPERMHKALNSGADALILDLEDSVSLAHKTEARGHVAAFLELKARRIPLFVRINPLSAGFVDQDLSVLSRSKPDALVLPKAEGATTIIELTRSAERVGAGSVPILPIATETPAALFHLASYAGVAKQLIGLTWGAEDLPAAIGAATSREPSGQYTAPYEVVRALALFAAHAAAVCAIETVYPAFRNLEGLAAYATRGARDGFTGMMAIHPSQVAIINTAFTPAPAAVDRARAVVAAFRAQPGAGVISLDGVMLDSPHLKQAMRILAQSDGSRQNPP